MGTKLIAALVGAGLVTLACNAHAAPAQAEVVCYGFEADAGQVDVWGTEVMAYNHYEAAIDLQASDNADENVFVCAPSYPTETGRSVVLTSYYTFSDDEGNVFARGTR